MFSRKSKKSNTCTHSAATSLKKCVLPNISVIPFSPGFFQPVQKGSHRVVLRIMVFFQLYSTQIYLWCVLCILRFWCSLLSCDVQSGFFFSTLAALSNVWCWGLGWPPSQMRCTGHCCYWLPGDDIQRTSWCNQSHSATPSWAPIRPKWLTLNKKHSLGSSWDTATPWSFIKHTIKRLLGFS